MGGAASFKPFNVTFPFFPIIITIILIGPCIVAEADDDTKETPPPIPSHDNDNGGIATTSSTVSAEHSGHHGKNSEPFKPSTVVVVCVLTTMFSIIFILLLYVKHCNAGNTLLTATNTTQPSEGRKNSGVDRAVVESLPIFRFRSLRGEKNGLDCAVCLTRFEDPEVLRLLPKCNHAFHVECVDTWLHAHSTCPLCRYKVDPEDIILVERQSQNQQQLPTPPPSPHQQSNNENEQLETERERNNNNNNNNNTPRPEAQNPNWRVSGRHSSAGEMDGGFLEIILQTPNENAETSSFRRSLDAGASRKIKSEEEGVGCFVRPRKDGMLLTKDDDVWTSKDHRLEHRIIVSPSNSSTKSHGGGVHQQRWSDVEPSDLLYLTSEMIISDSSSSQKLPLLWNTRGGRRTVRNRNVDDEMENGGVMNLRSVSEITGMSRFVRNGRVGEEQRHEGVVLRWLAWISKTRPPGDVR